MKSLIVVLALVLGAEAGGYEDLLRRVDRLDEQLATLLNIYQELLFCGNVDKDEKCVNQDGKGLNQEEKCMKNVKEKYIINGKYHWDDMVLGTGNTVVAIRKVLLEQIIDALKIELKKNPKNKQLADKKRDYEFQYKKLLEFEQAGGYD